jgi:hypothetical protein
MDTKFALFIIWYWSWVSKFRNWHATVQRLYSPATRFALVAVIQHCSFLICGALYYVLVVQLARGMIERTQWPAAYLSHCALPAAVSLACSGCMSSRLATSAWITREHP